LNILDYKLTRIEINYTVKKFVLNLTHFTLQTVHIFQRSTYYY